MSDENCGKCGLFARTSPSCFIPFIFSVVFCRLSTVDCSLLVSSMVESWSFLFGCSCCSCMHLMCTSMTKSHFWELILRRFVVLFIYLFCLHFGLICISCWMSQPVYWGICVVIFHTGVDIIFVLVVIAITYFFVVSQTFFHQFVAGSYQNFYTRILANTHRNTVCRQKEEKAIFVHFIIV